MIDLASLRSFPQATEPALVPHWPWLALAGPAKMGPMASPDLARLAQHVKGARLGQTPPLARRRAAELAGMSKDTWQRIEEAKPVQPTSYAKVDPVLGWAPGSCAGILEGREPVPSKRATSAPGVDISQPPVGDPGDKAREVIQLAMIATASGLTAEEIRDLSERAVNALKDHNLI